MRLSTILCEGPHDQAFWEGWLENFDIKSLPEEQRTSFHTQVRSLKYESSRREHALQSGTGDFVGVRPVDGNSFLVQNLKSLLRNNSKMRPATSLSNVVINLDPDTVEGDRQTGVRLPDVLRQVQEIDPTAQEQNGEILAFDGNCRIQLVRWEVAGETPTGVPQKQTLERLVCTALQRAYPVRASEVAVWLASRSDAPTPTPKSFAWSYMAGWYEDHGCIDFYKDVWRDRTVAAELEQILRHNGSWRVAEALAQNTR